MSDPVLKELQAKWYVLRDAWRAEGCPDASPKQREFHHHDAKLCKYLWDKVERDIAEDRRRHPKAKRNQVSNTTGGHGRHLP